MLLNDFYKVQTLETLSENNYKAVVVLNKDHNIFKGHFPDNPVTPGVCMMQIVKELSESITKKTLFMRASSNVKFMAIINPEKHNTLTLDLEFVGDLDSEFKVKNTSSFGDTVALKMTNTYNVV